MKIIIIGGKGTAVNIANQIVDAQALYSEKIEFLGYSIDDPALGNTIHGYPVLCNTNDLDRSFSKYSDVKYIYSLYKPEKMKERIELLKSYRISNEKFYTFIHPTAYVAENVNIGRGSVVLSHCSIHSNVSIGMYNVINSNVVIEHDTKISDHNFIAASVCIGSNIIVKNGSFIGLNSTIRENSIINDYGFIGMGSNVITDVASNTVVYGNPAKEYDHGNRA
ncbi:hypothetical protein [Paenibacillus sp. NPDC058174]|uniref:hypothetical protein n=1 Tax=Paenibacillus sp. NPDC058174 TaxID=3346366 RepID=UPI0036DF1FC8